jgi:hypothetical protein
MVSPVYMGESRTELTRVGTNGPLDSSVSRTIRSGGVTRLSMSPPPGARRACSSCIGGLCGGDTADIWRVYFRLVIVISYDLYSEARRALGGIERGPLPGCLRSRRSEVLPVVAAHIRIHVKFSPAIRERTFECCKTRAGQA